MKEKRANDEIRKKAEAARVPLWRIADRLGICEQTLCRHLRYEFTPKQKAVFLEAVDRIIEGRE